jgi:C4-dicarboxylate-specific signal transduction histidine kinase
LEYIGAVQDVTQRHLAEAALARARAELANAAKISSLAVLTASIAHEVSQPLSGIITNASTCLRMLERDQPNVDGVREMARLTLRDGKRASDVILRLRALFSKKEFAREPIDLKDAAREVIVLSLTDLERNRVILRTEFADDLPLAAGDRIQLQQVISNLLRNASEAMSAVDDRPRTAYHNPASPGRSGVPKRSGRRRRSRFRRNGSTFPAVLHDKKQRHGNRPFHQPFHNRKPPGPLMGSTE